MLPCGQVALRIPVSHLGCGGGLVLWSVVFSTHSEDTRVLCRFPVLPRGSMNQAAGVRFPPVLPLHSQLRLQLAFHTGAHVCESGLSRGTETIELIYGIY